jgi:hypothetical protein
VVDVGGDRLKSLTCVELERVEQLHSFLLESPENLESGLKILKPAVPTPCGDAIDLLGLDAEGRFVLLETKIGPDERLLERLIDHFDWFRTNQALFCQFHERENPSPDLPPRGILVGPGFDPTLSRRIEYLKGLEVDLFRYQVFLRRNSRFLSLERVGSNRSGTRIEEPVPAAAPAGLVPLSDEEMREFELFERERTPADSEPSSDSVIPIDMRFRR